MIKHYMFMDYETGEEFFVEAESKIEAKEKLKYWFNPYTCKYRGEFTPEESEYYPYDVY